MSDNIFGHPMADLPPDVKRCHSARWDEAQRRFVRCEYTKDHPGDHVRATAMWGLSWAQEVER